MYGPAHLREAQSGFGPRWKKIYSGLPSKVTVILSRTVLHAAVQKVGWGKGKVTKQSRKSHTQNGRSLQVLATKKSLHNYIWYYRQRQNHTQHSLAPGPLPDRFGPGNLYRLPPSLVVTAHPPWSNAPIISATWKAARKLQCSSLFIFYNKESLVYLACIFGNFTFRAQTDSAALAAI
jgi:hypothetical protein